MQGFSHQPAGLPTRSKNSQAIAKIRVGQTSDEVKKSWVSLPSGGKRQPKWKHRACHGLCRRANDDDRFREGKVSELKQTRWCLTEAMSQSQGPNHPLHLTAGVGPAHGEDRVRTGLCEGHRDRRTPKHCACHRKTLEV